MKTLEGKEYAILTLVEIAEHLFISILWWNQSFHDSNKFIVATETVVFFLNFRVHSIYWQYLQKWNLNRKLSNSARNKTNKISPQHIISTCLSKGKETMYQTRRASDIPWIARTWNKIQHYIYTISQNPHFRGIPIPFYT